MSRKPTQYHDEQVVKVDVTPVDISMGAPRSPRSCPISLAVQRALNYEFLVGVTGRNINIWTLDDERVITRVESAPMAVLEFACKFDDGEPVEPFSFKLHIQWPLEEPD